MTLPPTTSWLLVLGLLAGIVSGLMGVGGGIIIVPALVLVFGLSQHQAQGTSIALLLPPLGLLAAWTYHKHGYVDWRIAALICTGLLIGNWAGAKLAVTLGETTLRRLFGVLMLVVAVRLIRGR